MANSTVGQMAFAGTPADFSNKTTGAETMGGYGRLCGNLAGPVFAGASKLHGHTYLNGVPVARDVFLVAQNDPRTVLGYARTTIKDGSFHFYGLPVQSYAVIKLGGNSSEQGQIYDWEIANLP